MFHTIIFFPLNSSMIQDLPTSCPAPLRVCVSCVRVRVCVCVCVCACVCVRVCETYRGRMVSRSLSSAGLDVSALRLAMTATLPPQLTPTRPKAASYKPLVVLLRLPRGFFSPHSDRVSVCERERGLKVQRSTAITRQSGARRNSSADPMISEERARERENTERGG